MSGIMLPPPGSAAAVLAGCRCSAEDVAGGAAWMGLGAHAIHAGCPLHGKGTTPPQADVSPVRVSGDAWGGR